MQLNINLSMPETLLAMHQYESAIEQLVGCAQQLIERRIFFSPEIT